jgi:glucose-1-phosphate thymidylyltransferase
MSHFEDGKDFNANIEYVTQKKQLGTAHALSAAREFIDNEFMVLPGDNLVDSKALNDLLAQRKGASILITESAEPSEYGVVILSEGKAKDIIEKPKESIGNLISTGIYTLSSDIFELMENLLKEGKYNLTESIQKLAMKQEVYGVLTSGVWADAIYPWDLFNLNNLALTQIKVMTSGTVEKNVAIRGKVSIGKDTVIKSGSYIIGPVVIGSGCEIGPNVCIYPYVAQSVVGMGVRASSAFNANVGEALIKIEDEVHKVPKIGALIGEDSHLEGGVTASPGTIVGAKSKVSPLKHITGNIPNESIVV